MTSLPIRNKLTPWLAAVSIAACSSSPSPAAFERGATRTEIVQRFGAPNQIQDLVKRDEAIWGPIEDFWSEVPIGSRVEIWSYDAEGGSVELYFVDDSDKVNGTGFAPEGAVYESG